MKRGTSSPIHSVDVETAVEQKVKELPTCVPNQCSTFRVFNVYIFTGMDQQRGYLRGDDLMKHRMPVVIHSAGIRTVIE